MDGDGENEIILFSTQAFPCVCLREEQAAVAVEVLWMISEFADMHRL